MLEKLENFKPLNKEEEKFQKELEKGEEINEEKESEEKTESQKGSSYQPKWPEHFTKEQEEERKRKLENPNWFREQE